MPTYKIEKFKPVGQAEFELTITFAYFKGNYQPAFEDLSFLPL